MKGLLKENKNKYKQSWCRLHKENGRADRGRTKNARNDNAGKEKDFQRAFTGRAWRQQSPNQSRCKKAIIKTLVGSKGCRLGGKLRGDIELFVTDRSIP